MKKNDKNSTERAKKAYKDLKVRGEAAVGADAVSFVDMLMTPEERAESDIKVAIIGELISARKEKNISQKKLEELSGVKQPVIARIEKGDTNPQIGTVLKLLLPLGKKLAVVSTEE